MKDKTIDLEDTIEAPKECLNKNQIFGIVEELEKEWVPIPEWGENKGVYIKTMTALEKDDYQTSLVQRNPDGSVVASTVNSTAKLIAATAVGENGKLLFDFSDIVPLGNKSSVIMERLASVSRRMNAMGQKEMAAVLKNFLKTQSDDSKSD